jgi:hypothetical protein
LSLGVRTTVIEGNPQWMATPRPRHATPRHSRAPLPGVMAALHGVMAAPHYSPCMARCIDHIFSLHNPRKNLRISA